MSMITDLIVNYRQRGNAVLKHLDTCHKWTYGTTRADYEYRGTVIIIYIQLRYLLSHSDYLENRLSEFYGKSEDITRICLCFNDMNDSADKLMVKVNILCLRYDFSLLCAWSLADCAKYFSAFGRENHLELQRNLQNAQRQQLPLPKIKGLLAEKEIRQALLTKRTLAELFRSSEHDLSLIPGIRSAKSKILWKIFHSPLGQLSQDATVDEKNSEKHIPFDDESFLESFGTQIKS
uniref:ERCC1-like central domain-containing protein n=1 Tax=Paramoeba aestuarina TaxID=180227 RepID=A0A7S4NQQ0_9EUKA|mmetsp:Transcript_24467/g.38143  ORF Transcript_24467/g.38143 Transcript_24467/m.38143 type:complete len:235 (+) Transcript_24467:31-735(+)